MAAPGARYQMRREIKSFWYPTWLAQPAALVEGSKLIDAPPHRLRFADVAAGGEGPRSHRAAHLDAVVCLRREDRPRAQGRPIPNLKIGMIGAKVAVDADGQLCRPARSSISSPATSSTSPSRRWPKAATSPASRGFPIATPPAASSTTPSAPSCTTWTSCRSSSPVYKRDLDDRELLRRLSAAPVYVVLHRPRLQIALHLLPVAADRRRTQLPHAQRRPCHRRIEMGKQAFPQVKEVFFDDDTLTDNLPRVEELAREIGKLGIIWSCNAKGNVPRKTLEVLRTMACRLFAGRLRDPATSRSCTTSRRACWSTSPGASPRTATSSAS